MARHTGVSGPIFESLPPSLPLADSCDKGDRDRNAQNQQIQDIEALTGQELPGNPFIDVGDAEGTVRQQHPVRSRSTEGLGGDKRGRIA